MSLKLAISSYSDHDDAVDVISRLVHQGLSEVDIAVLSNEGEDRGWEQEPVAGDGAGREAGRAAWLTDQGASSAVAEECAAAAEAGHTLLAVRCNESNVAHVARVLEEGPHAERLEEDGQTRPATREAAAVPPATESGATGTVAGHVHVFDRTD